MGECQSVHLWNAAATLKLRLIKSSNASATFICMSHLTRNDSRRERVQKNNNSDKSYIHGRVSASVSPDVHSPARDGPCFHIRDRAATLMYKDDARGTRARGRGRKRGRAKRREREV